MSATVTICGLGPGGPGRLTEATADALAGDHPTFVRTRRHPSADVAAGAVAFDDFYELAGSFDEVYRKIADTVVDAACSQGQAVYAVPGSPLVLERSVRRIRELGEARGLRVEVLPALSFLDEAWAALGVDPVDDGVRLVDGLAFQRDAAGERGPLLVAHVHSQWVLSDIKIGLDAGSEQTAVVLQGLGTSDQRVFEVPWPELDRAVEADHLTTLFLPEVAAPVGRELVRSVEMMQRLRRECPWDREQDHATLRRYLIEEAYEVLDAIDEVTSTEAADAGSGRAYESLEEELGDLWFQILFHAELAAEAGQFAIADVARGITEKMIRRHPHVYGDRPTPSSADWDRLKQEEKERGSILDGIPVHLPALAKAQKVLGKAAGAGRPADGGALTDGLRSVLDGDGDGAVVEGMIGAGLLALVELARSAGIDAESALRETVNAASGRLRAVEAGLEPAPSANWAVG